MKFIKKKLKFKKKKNKILLFLLLLVRWIKKYLLLVLNEIQFIKIKIII